MKIRLGLSTSVTLSFAAATLAAWLAPRSAAAVDIIKFGDPGHTVSSAAAWSVNTSASGAENLSEHYQTSANNGATSTWDFGGLASGSYFVAVNWNPEPNRSTVANYALSDGGGNLLIDQTASIPDFAESVSGKAIGWKVLNPGAPLSILDGTLSVTLSDDDAGAGAAGFIMADAVRVSTSVNFGFPSGGVVIDDGDPGHQFLGVGPNTGINGGPAGWGISGGGYNADHYFDNEESFSQHSGALKSEWTFTGLTPGVPTNVSLTWFSPNSNRATNTPVTISGVVGGDQTVLINQELAPVANYVEQDQNISGFQSVHAFQSVGVFTPTGTTLTVTLANNANEFVIADAARVQQVPEPGSLLVALAGCLGAAVLLGRRLIDGGGRA